MVARYRSVSGVSMPCLLSAEQRREARCTVINYSEADAVSRNGGRGFRPQQHRSGGQGCRMAPSPHPPNPNPAAPNNKFYELDLSGIWRR